MAEQEEKIQQETPEKPETKESKGIPKTVWLIGGGCLLLCCIAVVVALLVYFGITYFGGRDPIAAVVPGDSMLYMGFNLAETQTDDFKNVVSVFQELAGEDANKTMAETMDEVMGDELNMSFTEDVMPWLGQYGGFAVTSGDLTSGEFDYLFILQTRDQGKADEFIAKYVAELEDSQGTTFDKEEKDRITFYTHKAEYDWEQDTVIARIGKFIYFANSEDIILNSSELKKSDSLASASGYKNAVAALPRKRLTTIYVNGTVYQDEFMTAITEEMYGPELAPTLEEIVYSGIEGFGMSVAVTGAGLQFDAAVSYDETQLTDYQKNALSVTHMAPTADKLVPEDTFFFLGANSSRSPGSFLEDDSQYAQDIKESLTLFDDQYGINVMDLLGFLNGEFSIAIGPSRDGLIASLGEVNMGVTMFASTNDEAGFNTWFEDVLNVASDEMMMDYQTDPAKFGSYELQELSIGDSGEMYSALIYGADNGYIILGTSQDILENGLNSDATLANNPTYRETWKAFPSKSVPYMYIDTLALLDFIKESIPYAAGDLDPAEAGLSKIPTIALSVNNASGYTQSVTLIIFVDTGQ